MTDSKRCSRCSAEKPLADFNIDRAQRDGRQAECARCKAERRALKKGTEVSIRVRGENHHDSRTRLYRKWKAMRERCDNPAAHNYRWYGGKGITYAAEWADWATFKNWAMSTGYEDGLELDRVEADESYGPDNCRWLTKRENIKRARMALLPETEALLEAEATALGVSKTDLITRIVNDHYKASTRPFSAGKEVTTQSVH